MKHFQFFCEIPEIDFMNELLACYCLNGFDQKIQFCKSNIVEMNTVKKLDEFLPEIVPYYLPCKAKTYMNELSEKRLITILFQFIKLYAYELYRKEK